jgi:TIR domain
MGPEHARLIRLGAAIAAAHLREDTTSRDQLLGSLGDTDAESLHPAPKAFAFLSHAAAGVLARLWEESTEQALRRVPAQDAQLVPGIPTDWQAAVNLVIAVHQNDSEIERISAVMDVPTAITSTFSVSIALIEEIAEGTGWSPIDTAMTFAETIRNFFISYTAVDRPWAEWIAWELEEAGYTTILQAWDFTPGSHFVTAMYLATQTTERTIAVLSRAYLQSVYSEQEWQAAWAEDPTGVERKLLVLRIEDCPRPGLLGQVVSEDLFGVGKEMARTRLLAAVQEGRRKPPMPPQFPGEDPPATEPDFPGLVPGDLDEAMAAGGPMTPDNPYAVAFAFWHAALNENYDDLEAVITPESGGQWDLAEIRARTEGSGIATGVYQPRYDVAYVKLISNLGDKEEPIHTVSNPLPVEARIISLVYRPELGGWRVHGLGHPVDPTELPRSHS